MTASGPGERTASTKGILYPTATEQVAGLRRDHHVTPELAPFIERYWSVRWDLGDRAVHRSEVLSHPSVNVSVETGDRPRFGFVLPAVLLHGVVTRRFTVDLVGSGRVTAAKLRPGGFVAMTGVQPRNDSAATLRDELGVDPRRLLDSVLAQEDDVARAVALDAALAPLASQPPAPYLHLLGILAEMMHDRELIRVEDVATHAGLTVRSLQRLFASYVGVGPKAVLARYRLHDAVAAIDSGEVEDLAGLAASLGWYDQAHFSRDFRAVVGTTPSQYLSRTGDLDKVAP